MNKIKMFFSSDYLFTATTGTKFEYIYICIYLFLFYLRLLVIKYI